MRSLRVALCIGLSALGACSDPAAPERPDLSGRWAGSGPAVNADFLLELTQTSAGDLRGVAVSSAQFSYRVTGHVDPEGSVTMHLTDIVFVSIDQDFTGKVESSGQRIAGQLRQGGTPASFVWTREPSL